MFIYRYDSIECLYRQRLTDKTLRARCSDGSEAQFSHEQVKEAHLVAPQGYAVFRLSFWKDLQAAKDNRIYNQGYALQRINAAHKTLESFNEGVDQYLPETAYLFWATMPVNAENPDWSPIGIPHEDIEVQLPTGEWIPLNNVGVFRDVESDWFTFPFHSTAGKECHLQIKHGQIADGGIWAVIRQQLYKGSSYYNAPDGLIHYLEKYANAYPDSIWSKFRWVYVLESYDKLHAIEVFPKFKRRFLSGIFPPRWRVDNCFEECPKELPEALVSSIYRSFGCEDLLLRSDSWNYRD